MTVILSVDPGYRSCGWAVASYEGQKRVLVDSGDWQTTAEHGPVIQRIAVIVGFYETKLDELKPDGVGFEAYTYQRRVQQNSVVAAGVVRLIDRMEEAARRRGIPVEEVPTSLAKMALGLKGKVSKKRVQTAVEAMFGVWVGSHRADSVAVNVATRSRLLARGIGR